MSPTLTIDALKLSFGDYWGNLANQQLRGSSTITLNFLSCMVKPAATTVLDMITRSHQ